MPWNLVLAMKFAAWWSALQRRNTKKSPTVSDHRKPSRSW